MKRTKVVNTLSKTLNERPEDADLIGVVTVHKVKHTQPSGRKVWRTFEITCKRCGNAVFKVMRKRKAAYPYHSAGRRPIGWSHCDPEDIPTCRALKEITDGPRP